jgi:FixJ family two-component response regulator
MPREEKNVVVVEDDSSMRQAIERLLRAASFQTIAFDSAEALLEANATTNAACLVIDIRLPGLSGFELHRRLAEFGATPPVIFITAHDMPSARQQAQDIGEYLTKPFPGQNLVDAVRRAFGSLNRPM